MNHTSSPHTPGAPTALLQLQDVGFAYPGQPALASGWSTSIGPGVTLLHGDTGAGKSTLLRVLAGTLPASGRLALCGARLDTAPQAYRRSVFFADPASDAFDQATVRECTAALGQGDAHFSEAKWQALVDGFALAPHLDKHMYMLSTGSRRKVCLAAALASGRPLVLLDEPTAALDAASVRCLWAALAGFAASPDRAVIVASAAQVDEVGLAGVIVLPLG